MLEYRQFTNIHTFQLSFFYTVKQYFVVRHLTYIQWPVNNIYNISVDSQIEPYNYWLTS